MLVLQLPTHTRNKFFHVLHVRKLGFSEAKDLQL